MTVRIIGLGNVLMSDDGFGPYVVRVFDALYECPPEVEVVDAGTPGLDLTPFLLDTDAVLFVDTVKASGRAGGVHAFGLADILGTTIQPRLGPHDPGLKDALLTVAAAGREPRDVLLIGAVPMRVAAGVTLSAPMRGAVRPLIRRLRRELAIRGIASRRRTIKRQPDTWWSRDGADRKELRA